MYNELDYEMENALNKFKDGKQHCFTSEVAEALLENNLVVFNEYLTVNEQLCTIKYNGKEVLRVGGWLAYKKQKLEEQAMNNNRISIGGNAIFGNNNNNVAQSDNQSSSKIENTNNATKQSAIIEISIGIFVGVVVGIIVYWLTK